MPDVFVVLRGTLALALAAFALSLAAGCGGGATADETEEMLRQDFSVNGDVVHRVDCEQDEGDAKFWCAINFTVQDHEMKGTMHVTCDRRAQRGEKCLLDAVPPPRCAQGNTPDPPMGCRHANARPLLAAVISLLPLVAVA
jgi:hypothetical protein